MRHFSCSTELCYFITSLWSLRVCVNTYSGIIRQTKGMEQISRIFPKKSIIFRFSQNKKFDGNIVHNNPPNSTHFPMKMKRRKKAIKWKSYTAAIRAKVAFGACLPNNTFLLDCFVVYSYTIVTTFVLHFPNFRRINNNRPYP